MQALTLPAFTTWKSSSSHEERFTQFHLREESWKHLPKWWIQILIDVSCGYSQETLPKSNCQQSVRGFHTLSYKRMTYAVDLWFCHSQRDRNLYGYKSETEQMERDCGRSIAVGTYRKVFLSLPAVLAHLAITGNLEGSCLGLLYIKIQPFLWAQRRNRKKKWRPGISKTTIKV